MLREVFLRPNMRMAWFMVSKVAVRSRGFSDVKSPKRGDLEEACFCALL